MIEPSRDNDVSGPVVLVVEDEVLIRLATSDALRDEGFEVVEAANADEGLAYLQTNHVDLVLTDVRMPGSMDGLEFARRIARDHSNTTVIVASGHVEQSQVPSDVPVITKPFEMSRLVRLVQASLERGTQQ